MVVDDDAVDGGGSTKRPRRLLARRRRHRPRAARTAPPDQRRALPRGRPRRIRLRARLLLARASQLARLPILRFAESAAAGLLARLVPRRPRHRPLAPA